MESLLGDGPKGVRAAYKLWPNDSTAKAAYWNLLRSGGLKGASKAFELWPNDQIVILNYKEALCQAGLSEARTAFELWPDDPSIISNYKEALSQAGLTEAREAFESWPDDPSIISNYKEALCQAGLTEARKAFELWPSDPNVIQRYKDLLCRRPSFGESLAVTVDEVQAAHERWPDDPMVKARYISTLSAAGRARTAYELWPADANAQSAYRNELSRGGLADLRAALALWPEDKSIRALLAKALVEAGGAARVLEGLNLLRGDHDIEQVYLKTLESRDVDANLITEISAIEGHLSEHLRIELKKFLRSNISFRVEKIREHRDGEASTLRLFAVIELLYGVSIFDEEHVLLSHWRRRVVSPPDGTMAAELLICVVFVLIVWLLLGIRLAWTSANIIAPGLAVVSIAATCTAQAMRRSRRAQELRDRI